MTSRHRMIATGAALLVSMAISYAWIDRPLSLFCRDLEPGIVQIFQWITELGVSTGYLIGLAALFVFFRFIRPHAFAVRRTVFVFASIAVSGIAINLIKPFVGRLRPKLLFEGGLYGFEPLRIGYEYNSFPSGHATTVFALAASLALLFPRWRLPLFGFALLVGLSRIAVGAHYLSDVMGGAYAGVMTVFLLFFLCRRSGWLDLSAEADRTGAV